MMCRCRAFDGCWRAVWAQVQGFSGRVLKGGREGDQVKRSVMLDVIVYGLG